LSFIDSFFLSSTSHYGSARVKDTGTPANNYNSHPFGLLSYPGASVKLCRGPGNLRYGAHNLLLYSEKIGIETGSDGWSVQNLIITDGHPDPLGGNNAQLLVKNTVGDQTHRVNTATLSG